MKPAVMRIITSIYKTARKEGLYLYVNKQKGLDCIPDALRELMGNPELVMNFLLTEERPLANADTADVLQKLQDQGYYLQMPPADQKDDYAITLPDEFLGFNDPV